MRQITANQELVIANLDQSINHANYEARNSGYYAPVAATNNMNWSD